MLFLSMGLVAILAIEVPGLVKKKMWRELAVFLGIFMIGTIYSIGQVMRIDLPNPTDLLEVIYGPVSNIIEPLLKPPGQQ